MGCGCSGRQKEHNEAFQKFLEKKYAENVADFHPGVKLMTRLDLDIIDSTPWQNQRDSYTQQNRTEIEGKIMTIKKEIENVLLMTAEMDIKRKELINLFKEISSFLRIEVCYADNFPSESWTFFKQDKFFIQVSVLNNQHFPRLKTKKKDPSEGCWFEVLSWETPIKNEWEINRGFGSSTKKKKKKAMVQNFKLNSSDYINFEVCKHISKGEYEVVGNGLIGVGPLFDQEFKEIKLNINLFSKNKKKEWFTLFVRAQLIIDLHFLLDSQHKMINNYNEVLVKAYRKFVNIMNVTPRGTMRKSALNNSNINNNNI